MIFSKIEYIHFLEKVSKSLPILKVDGSLEGYRQVLGSVMKFEPIYGAIALPKVLQKSN